MSSRKCVTFDESVASGFFDSIDYVLTDCDGVLWMGSEVIPGSVDAINTLKNMGKHIIYVTNNSTKNRESYLTKCANLGFPVTLDDVIPTSFVAATYLKSKNFDKKVYVLGSQGITDELERVGIRYLPIGPDPVAEDWISALADIKLDPEVGAVIVGFDHHISYPKLTKAASYLRKKDVLFLATNRDEQFPTENDLTIPGSGTFVTAVEVVSGRSPIVLGKPQKYMLDSIQHVYPDIQFSRCLMIGDRLNTDIMLGTLHGLKTLLVGTGINSLEDVREFEKSSNEEDHLLVPDYYLPCLGDLTKFTKA